MKLHVVHGIHTRKPERIEAFASEWEHYGFTPEVHAYGWVSAIRARRAAEEVGAKIAAERQPMCVIGYSNGAAACYIAARLGADIKHMALLHPALRRDIDVPAQVRRIDVVADPNDRALQWSPRWRTFRDIVTLGLLGDHWWGSLGRDGYTGPDTDDVHVHWRTGGHGDVLNDYCDGRKWWAQMLAGVADATVRGPT